MKPIKFIRFRQYCKYALITIALTMLILSALLFYHNISNVKAADEPTTTAEETITQNPGDFYMKPIETYTEYTNNERNVVFNASVRFGDNEALNERITQKNHDTYISSAGINIPAKLENYVVIIFTKDISNFYKLDDYSSLEFTNTIDGFFEECLPGCDVYITTNGESNYTTNKYTFSSMSGAVNFSVNKKYSTYDKNTTYYAFATSFTHLYAPYIGTNISMLNFNYKTDNYVEFNETKSVQHKLKTCQANSSSSELKAYHKFLGLDSTGDTTVNVNFLRMTSLTEYENATLSFVVPTIYAKSAEAIEELLYETLSEQGYTDITSFNATYISSLVDENGNHLDLSEKIVRKATGLSFTPEFNDNKVQTVNVTYSDFDYSNIALYVSSNDHSLDTGYLTMPVYTTTVTLDELNNVIITFNFDTIERQLYNSLKWLFTLDKDNVIVNGKADSINVIVTDDNITIKFKQENEPDLFGLSLTATADIIEDYEITYNIKYIELDNELTPTTLTSNDYVCWYSEFVNLTNSTNFYTLHGDFIEEAISPMALNDVKYYTYSGVNSSVSSDNTSAVITVNYNYNTLFKLVSFGNVYYTDLYKDTFEYTLNDLNLDIPNGFRICNVTTSNPYVTLVYDDSNPLETSIKEHIQNNTSNILTIYVDVTDFWNIDVNYLTPYYSAVDGALTPFFELTTLTTEAKVLTFNKSIYEFDAGDVCKLVGLETLNNSTSSVKDIEVTFNNPTYTLNVIYNPTTVNRIDYDGNIYEILVTPTSYADWCEFYNKDWTIRFLNMPGKQYFKYVDDIAKDKLYGYFSVAVFEEQVSDFNYYFRKDSGAGCMAFYKSTEVKGSDLYKFFGDLKDSIFFSVGYTGMALCEIINNENAIYSSYFFYVDGTSDDMYLSNGGADSSKDQNSALENSAQDFGEWLSSIDFAGFFNDINDFITWLTVAGVILGVCALIGFALFVFLKKGK